MTRGLCLVSVALLSIQIGVVAAAIAAFSSRFRFATNNAPSFTIMTKSTMRRSARLIQRESGGDDGVAAVQLSSRDRDEKTTTTKVAKGAEKRPTITAAAGRLSKKSKSAAATAKGAKKNAVSRKIANDAEKCPAEDESEVARSAGKGGCGGEGQRTENVVLKAKVSVPRKATKGAMKGAKKSKNGTRKTTKGSKKSPIDGAAVEAALSARVAAIGRLPRTREKEIRSMHVSPSTSSSSRGVEIIGVDEAGRGPLAGPVVAAAAIVPTDIDGIVDSKKITSEERREELYEAIVSSPGVRYAVAIVSAGVIDEINILQATLEGMKMAVTAIVNLPLAGEDEERNVVSVERKDASYVVTGGEAAATSLLPPSAGKGGVSYHALIDGNKIPPEMPCSSESMIKGDGREYSIGAASILAKVTRDRLMHGYDVMYPEFNLRQHKGYPTAAHMGAVRKYGASPIHRRTFAPLKHMNFDKDGNVAHGSK